MEPFVTIEAYRRRYPDDDVADGVLLEVLADATMAIASELDAEGIGYDEPTDEFANRLASVCRNVAHRVIGEGDESEIPFGASQFSEGAGSYKQTVSMANPYGDVFLTAAERRALGIGSQRGAVFSPYGGT